LSALVLLLPIACSSGAETTSDADVSSDEDASGGVGALGNVEASSGGMTESSAGGAPSQGTGAASSSGGATSDTGGSVGSGGEDALGSGGTGGSDADVPAAGGMDDSGGTGNGSGGAIGVDYDRPDGTIPNSPQSPDRVGVSESDWAEGLISPTFLKGNQINQPQVLNGYLIIAGNEKFWIYDVSDPTSPQQLSEFTTPGATGQEAESHTVSFARYGDTFYMVTIGGKGIDIWDVTTTTGSHVAKVAISGTNYGDYTESVWGVSWQGQYIYVGATNNGIKVVDAADPSAPEVVAEVPTSAFGNVSAGPIDAIGNVLVVMTPKESGGVATLDISDPQNPTRLASFTTSTSYIGQFYRRWVFLISPLRSWDVLTDPRNIGSGNSPLDTLDHGGAEYLSFGDDRLYLGQVRKEIDGKPGAWKVDISDPSNMQGLNQVWGRLDQGDKNDDQFTVPIGNLLVIGDDQSPYAGAVIAVHQAEPDTKAPIVDSVVPKDGSTDVATTSRIGLSFSDNIELATVNSASFIVRPVGGEPLSGRFGVRMGVLNFDPEDDLEPGTTYEVVLPQGGIADYVGNTLTDEWSSTFTTK
jgi:hypothetical protein